MQKLKIGDTVQVTAGAERHAANKRGKILRIDREKDRVAVEGVRMVTRHLKAGRDRNNQEGGRIEKPGTIAIASVSLVCPKCDKATRVGVRVDGEKKKRFCKNCDAIID